MIVRQSYTLIQFITIIAIFINIFFILDKTEIFTRWKNKQIYLTFLIFYLFFIDNLSYFFLFEFPSISLYSLLTIYSNYNFICWYKFNIKWTHMSLFNILFTLLVKSTRKLIGGIDVLYFYTRFFHIFYLNIFIIIYRINLYEFC